MRNKKTSLLLLLLACAVLLATGTYAAYTNVEYIKRVVSTRAGVNELRFSSNYLSSYVSAIPRQLISVREGAGISVTVTVCNYPQNDTTLVSEDTIIYDLTAKLVRRDGTEIGANESIQYTDTDAMTGAQLAGSIQINGQSSWTLSNQQLPGEQSSRNQYLITCSDASAVKCLSTVALDLKATPTSGVGTSLAAQLRFAAAAEVDANWTYRFTDQLDDDTRDLDAFNVEIYGSSQGTGTLTWDTDRVMISQWSIAELGGSGNPGSITFALGAPDQPTRYRLQFYRVNGIPKKESGTDVKSYIHFSFSPG